MTAAANLAWEIAHLPLYTIWATAPAREQVFAVVHCTGGDLLITLSTLTLGLLVGGGPGWPRERFAVVAAVTVLSGLVTTAVLEWVNVAVRGVWTYSDWMPTVGLFGFDAGLSPLLQWIIVPAIGFWTVTRRCMRAAD